jgi:DNA polymerase-1
MDNCQNKFSLKNYQQEIIESARKLGYIETILGRRRYLADINSANAVVRGFAERNAINAPIQGSAADIIKVAMVNLHDELNKRKMRSRMILQVHDELVFDVHVSEEMRMQTLVKEAMENAIKLVVPMEVEWKIAPNWLEAH